MGGKDGYLTWQLVHRHRYDQKTAADDPLVGRGRREVPVARARIKDGVFAGRRQ
jgi:hypothetical protein